MEKTPANVIQLSDLAKDTEGEFADECSRAFGQFIEQGREAGLPDFAMFRMILEALRRCAMDDGVPAQVAFQAELLSFVEDHYSGGGKDEPE